MNKRQKTEKRGIPTPLALLGALLLALLLEMVVFNRNALRTAGRTWTPLPTPNTVDDKLAEEKRLALFFYDLYQEIDCCHIDIEVRNAEGEPVATSFMLRISDEGSSDVYRVGMVNYFPSHDKGAWVPLHAYGRVRHLTVEILAEKPGYTWTLRRAEINGSVPFQISVLRIAGLFALFALLWLLRPGSAAWDNRLWNRRPWVKALCLLLILLLNFVALGRLSLTSRFFQNLSENAIAHQQYTRLARSLTEGRTWIEGDGDREALELLGQMQNPYDGTARKAVFQDKDFKYAWDTAYYHGHYYVYFGVVPVLLFYLPYYLLTGSDLLTVYAIALIGALVVLAAFAFLRALIRRYFPQTPFPAYLLLSLLMGNCTGVLFFSLEPSFYNLPLLLSLAFVLFGLALWLSAAGRWDLALEGKLPQSEEAGCCFAPLRSPGRPGGVALRLAAGSLLCALTAGTRPQFLVFSALALPIFLPLLRRESRGGVTFRRLLAFALPYAAVAAPLMYYNYIRFGSPFDFGANYNLTTNDMTRRGFRLARLADGLYAYLFRVPNVEISFPYVKEAVTTPVYMGRTIMEPMFGGAFLLCPFLWSLLGTRRVSPLLRAKKLRGLVWLPLVLALVVVAADTEMAGILWRYTGDFYALLFLAASVVFLALLQTASPHRRRGLLSVLAVTTLLALLTCLLISVTHSLLQERDAENYYRLKDFLSVV